MGLTVSEEEATALVAAAAAAAVPCLGGDDVDDPSYLQEPARGEVELPELVSQRISGAQAAATRRQRGWNVPRHNTCTHSTCALYMYARV